MAQLTIGALALAFGDTTINTTTTPLFERYTGTGVHLARNVFFKYFQVFRAVLLLYLYTVRARGSTAVVEQYYCKYSVVV